MNKKELRGMLLLLAAAMVWGCAFVAQKIGSGEIPPFTFQASRFLIGAAVLVPVILISDRVRRGAPGYRPPTARQKKTQRLSGLVCGGILFCASSLQQIGIGFTTVGKAGFITALYILIVPLLGLFLRQKVSCRLWICILVAVAGLYLLCMNEGFSLSLGDSLVLLCALAFSFHILSVDHFSPSVDGVRLAATQFLVAGVLAGIVALISERPTWDQFGAAMPSILYTGVCSSGIGYTFQILGQKDTRPAIASLLMSFESVFAALAGALILQEIPTPREGLGCVLMFAAVVFAQLPFKKKARNG